MPTTIITPETLKKDDNLLCSLELPESLQVYLTYQGSNFLHYHTFLNGVLLFEGKDYKPSPLCSIDSLDSIISLLGFLTCQIGDTDNEYFAKYTPAQLAWCNSFECEQLKGLVSDYDNKQEKQYYNKARKFFTKHFKTY